eukprot:4900713-Amphidinium_carterae.2
MNTVGSAWGRCLATVSIKMAVFHGTVVFARCHGIYNDVWTRNISCTLPQKTINIPNRCAPNVKGSAKHPNETLLVLYAQGGCACILRALGSAHFHHVDAVNREALSAAFILLQTVEGQKPPFITCPKLPKCALSPRR